MYPITWMALHILRSLSSYILWNFIRLNFRGYFKKKVLSIYLVYQNVQCKLSGMKTYKYKNMVNTSHYVINLPIPKHADEHKYFDIAQAQQLDSWTSSWTILSNLYGHIKKTFLQEGIKSSSFKSNLMLHEHKENQHLLSR